MNVALNTSLDLSWLIISNSPYLSFPGTVIIASPFCDLPHQYSSISAATVLLLNLLDATPLDCEHLSAPFQVALTLYLFSVILPPNVPTLSPSEKYLSLSYRAATNWSIICGNAVIPRLSVSSPSLSQQACHWAPCVLLDSLTSLLQVLPPDSCSAITAPLSSFQILSWIWWTISRELLWIVRLTRLLFVVPLLTIAGHLCDVWTLRQFLPFFPSASQFAHSIQHVCFCSPPVLYPAALHLPVAILWLSLNLATSLICSTIGDLQPTTLCISLQT